VRDRVSHPYSTTSKITVLFLHTAASLYRVGSYTSQHSEVAPVTREQLMFLVSPQSVIQSFPKHFCFCYISPFESRCRVNEA
jgi:hypothetical protein